MITITNIKQMRGYKNFPNMIKKMDIDKLNRNWKKLTDFVNGTDPYLLNNDKTEQMDKNCGKQMLKLFDDELKKRSFDTHNDAPVAVVEKTIPNMAEKTEPETDRTAETEPKKKPKIPKMAKPQKTKTAPKPKKTKTARKPTFKITDYEQFWKSIM